MQLSTGAIAGIVVGSILGFLIIITSVAKIIIVHDKGCAAHSAAYRSWSHEGE